MALFRRSAAQTAPEQDAPKGDVETTTDEQPARPAHGPFDATQVSSPDGRADLGAVWLPTVPGMELRMEADRKSGRITGAALAVNGSGLQVQAFAAPRTLGIWDEIRGEIAASVAQQGGAVDDVPGPFGRELLARLPAKKPDGTAGFRPARFIGTDGPRWFLRGVITGPAAVDPEQARMVESIFANIVVVRDDTARPPRDLLEMHLPGEGSGLRSGRSRAPGALQDGSPVDPLTRGPEITEIR